jgi:subfamily B ATP-binding cassette protein MsbA
MPHKSKEKSVSLYLRIISYLRPYIRHLAVILAFNLFFVIFNTISIWMVAPLLTTIFEPNKPIVEQGIVTEEETTTDQGIFNLNNWMKQKLDKFFVRDDKVETLKILCLFILIAFFLKNASAYGIEWWFTFVEQRFIKDIRDDLYEHILWQPLSFFSKYQTGNLMSRITNDINALNESIKNNFTKIIRDPLLIIIFLTLLISISWQLTLIASVVFPVTGVLITKIGHSLKRKSRRVQERIADVTTVIQETITGVKVVKAFSMEKYENEKFRNKTFDHFKAVLRQMRLHRLSGPLSETLGISIMVGVLWFGGQLVLSGELLSSRDFISFIAILFSIMDPIKKLGQFNNDVQISLATGRRIINILDTPIAISDKPHAQIKNDFFSDIHYENVHFRYSDKGDFTKNQKLAIVGGSGAGKTTIVNLLPRFYEIDQGTIKIDNINIRDLKLASLRKLMGIVTQDVILFNDTVANNIAYGMNNYPLEKIQRAAQLANAHEFIEQMPEGYQTMIGERGMRLSGGQRQRISIARAILKNPPILIFDEATSSLDSEAERLIQEAIENLMKDRTVLIIAHRLSSIMRSDKIIVLEEGRIIDEGTHEELIERSARYNYLYKLQFAV